MNHKKITSIVLGMVVGIVAIAVVVTILFQCFKTDTKKEKNVFNHEYQSAADYPYQYQDLTDITKLEKPNEIIYLHDGKEIVISDKDEKYNQIIDLNNKRQTNKLDSLKLAIDYSNINNNDYLIYKYTDNKYMPVYFSLTALNDSNHLYVYSFYYPAVDENGNSYVDNNGGVNLPDSASSDPTRTFVYGHLSLADELVDYINSQSNK